VRGKRVWAEVVPSLPPSRGQRAKFSSLKERKEEGLRGPLLCGGGGKIAWVLGVRTMLDGISGEVPSLSAPGATSMIPSALAMVGSVDPTPFLNLTDTPLLVWQIVVACSLTR